jgi:hypothetical protein
MKQVSSAAARSALLILLSLASAGCVPAYPEYRAALAAQAARAAQAAQVVAAPTVSQAEIQGVAARAARQVQRCYRSPRIARSAREIVTKLRVRFGRDGALVGMPTVVSQSGVTPGNHFFADEMAQAATSAVIRCSPVHLPPALWATGWSELDLTFSPLRLA